MPREWVDPDVACDVGGIKVWYCYDDADQLAEFHYTTDPSDCNIDSPLEPSFQFDIRDVEIPPEIWRRARILNFDQDQIYHAVLMHVIRERLVVWPEGTFLTPQAPELHCVCTRQAVVLTEEGGVFRGSCGYCHRSWRVSYGGAA